MNEDEASKVYTAQVNKQSHDESVRLSVSPSIKVVGYILMAVLSGLVLEALSYSYLRIVEGYDGKHLLSYQFDDYKNIQLTPNYSNAKGVYHNAQGFRENEDIPKQKQEGTYRIFIMGGSTAYGLGAMSKYGHEKYAIISNNETIDYYLEKYLETFVTNKKVQVINAAITSHYSHHHLIYLNQVILKYHPDMVIFIDGFNDYFPYKKDFDQFRDYAYQERAHLYMDQPTLEALVGYTGWWLFRKSHFVHVATKAVRPLWLSIKGSGEQRAKIQVDEAIDNLRINAENNYLKMVQRNALILRNEGVVPVFVLQPEIVFQQSKVFSEMERAIFEEMGTHWQENFVEYKAKARPLVVEYLQRTTKKTNAPFFDLTDVFGGMKEDVFTDYTHLTPMGNKRLAEELGARILPLLQEGDR